MEGYSVIWMKLSTPYAPLQIFHYFWVNFITDQGRIWRHILILPWACDSIPCHTWSPGRLHKAFAKWTYYVRLLCWACHIYHHTDFLTLWNRYWNPTMISKAGVFSLKISILLWVNHIVFLNFFFKWQKWKTSLKRSSCNGYSQQCLYHTPLFLLISKYDEQFLKIHLKYDTHISEYLMKSRKDIPNQKNIRLPRL